MRLKFWKKKKPIIIEMTDNYYNNTVPLTNNIPYDTNNVVYDRINRQWVWNGPIE